MPKVNRQGKGTHRQSILFSKKFWTADSAKSWLKNHDLFTDGHEETDNYHRFRQVDPDGNKFRYINKVLSKKDGENSIIAIIGYPKSAKAKDFSDKEILSDVILSEIDERLAREVEKILAPRETGERMVEKAHEKVRELALRVTIDEFVQALSKSTEYFETPREDLISMYLFIRKQYKTQKNIEE